MEIFIKDITSKDNPMDLGNISGKMEILIEVSLKKVKGKDLVN
jgi:hypothetical protein